MIINTLDKIDRQIVSALQRNNRISVAEICDDIGLTLATCHRRLKRIRESGIILKEAAIIDPRFSAHPLMVILEINMAKDRAALEQKLSSLKEISMCWAVSGPADFVAIGFERFFVGQNPARFGQTAPHLGDSGFRKQDFGCQQQTGGGSADHKFCFWQ